MINRANVHHTHKQGRIDFPSVGKEIRMLSEQSRADSKVLRDGWKKNRTYRQEGTKSIGCKSPEGTLVWGRKGRRKRRKTPTLMYKQTPSSRERKRNKDVPLTRGRNLREKQEETKTHWSKQRKKVKRNPGKHLPP
jgi:hypothetical protein